MFIYFTIFRGYSVCLLDVLIVDAYQKIAKIADRQLIVQIVVGKNVAAGTCRRMTGFKCDCIYGKAFTLEL